MNLSDLQPITKVPFHGVILPKIEISPEQRAAVGAKPDCSNVDFLTQLCRDGFKRKLQNKLSPEQRKQYADQVKLEIGIIEELGFTNYILMVWDICRYADEVKIPRGPGRGSVGSSLVAYLVDITNLDPVKNHLFFARFLSKSRAKSKIIDGVKYIDGSLCPDIDGDYSFYRRNEMIDYIARRYPGQTSKLLTTTTFTSKILIKDVMKTYVEATEPEANEVSDMIEREFGVPQEIEDAIWGDSKWREGDQAKGKAPNQRFELWSKDHMEICQIAMALSGLNRSEGQHASAVLISYAQIDTIMPLQLSSAKESVSAYDMYSAQEIMLKFDVLGLRTLDVIDEACALVGINRDDIDIHHPSVYQSLQDFKYRYGIFQLETFAQGTAAAKVKPKNFEELAAVLALCRPGAFAYLDQYVKYVQEGVYNSIHPLIDDILKPMGGVCLYQEQYLAMLKRIGMSDEQAENARRVLGKKKKEEVPAVIEEIRQICKQNGHPVEIVDLLVKIAYDSGGYSFNASHANSYAMLTAYTLYLKANHPLAFYLALLKMARHETEPHEIIAQIEREMRAAGFHLLPPRFTQQEVAFKIEDDHSIRFGLNLIRGVSDKSMEKLQAFIDNSVKTVRERGGPMNKFEIFEALRNAKLHIGIISALIQAGCMEGHENYVDKDGKPFSSRPRLVLEIHTWNLLSDKEKVLCKTVGDRPEVNWDVLAAIKHLSGLTNEKGKPLITEKRLGTLRKKYQPYADIYNMNRQNERLANYFYEKKVLGYSYSETLSGVFGEKIDGLSTVAEIKEMEPNSYCRVVGFVSEPEKRKTKKGNDEFKFILKDETGEIRVKAFNDIIKVIETMNKRLPEEEDIVIVNCRKMEGDTVFVQRGLDGCPVGISTAKIYMRLSELKDAEAAKEEKEVNAAQKSIEESAKSA